MTFPIISGCTTRRLLTVLVLILSMLVPFATTYSASAQDGEVSEDGFTDDFTYESLFGYTLTWDETWELDADGSGFYVADLADSLYFTQDGGVSSLSIVALPSIGSIASSVAFYTEYYGGVLDSAELVETIADKQEGHSLIRFETDGVPYALYVRVFLTADSASEIQAVVSGELDGFDELLESVQESFGVDDEPILADLESAEALDLLEDGDPVPFPTPSGQFTSDDEKEDNPSENEDIKLPDDEDPDAEPTEEDVEPDATEVADDADPEPTEEDEDAGPEPTEDGGDPDLADQGLIGEGEYESPQFGLELTWSSDWVVFADGLSSNEASGIDQLALDSVDLDASFYLTIFSSDTLTPEEWLSGFEELVADSPDNLEIVDQSEVDGSQIVLYSFDFDDRIGYGVVEVYEDSANDVLVIVEVAGTEDTIVEAFESVLVEIELDGDVPFLITKEVPELP